MKDLETRDDPGSPKEEDVLCCHEEAERALTQTAGVRLLCEERGRDYGDVVPYGKGLPLLVLRLPPRSGTPRPNKRKNKSTVCPT